MNNKLYNLLKLAEVIAHVAGPSGCGKSTLAKILSEKHDNVVIKDLDDLDNAAKDAINLNKHKKITGFTNSVLKKLRKKKQELLDKFLAKCKKKVILVGHHTEDGEALSIDTPNKILLNVSPSVSAKRVYMRSQKDEPSHRQVLRDIVKNKQEAVAVANELKQLNYKPHSFNKTIEVLTKLIKTSQDLAAQPHQERVAKKLQDPNVPGQLVYHGLGSGKTFTSINAAEPFGGATVVTPASLQENFKKEIANAKAKGKYDVMSYEKFTKYPPNLQNKLLILDEAHRIRTSGSERSQQIRKGANQAVKKILLTGTPIQNKPHEIAPLINAITGTNTFPLSPGEFNSQFLEDVKKDPSFIGRIFGEQPVVVGQRAKNLPEFRRRIQGLVDYYTPGEEAKKYFPTVTEKEEKVDMTPDQVALYKKFLGQLGPGLHDTIQQNLPPKQSDLERLNTFANAVRQIANTEDKYDPEKDIPSPKVKAIVDRIKASTLPAVAYSNYLDSGLRPLAAQLQRENIPYGLFTGELSAKDKKALVEAYNNQKLKALLISSSGGEGLDLKRTGQVHIMEPHWNEPKVEQVIGRGARYKSHESLPEDQRKVEVYRYLSQLPENQPNLLARLFGAQPTRESSIDNYLAEMSKRKKALNDQFLQILREEGSK